MSAHIVARSPGRVNLIGDHTDYTGGLVLPMAIDRYTTITATAQRHVAGRAPGRVIDLISASEPDRLLINLPIDDPAAVRPAWGRYVAGVAAQLGDTARGISGSIACDIPIGAGLSSSAALELATALALGDISSPEQRAQLCRRAEHAATGVPCGIMDQLVCSTGVDNHALLIDCNSLKTSPVQLPGGIKVVVQLIAHRTLVGSEYSVRVAQCQAAEQIVGPLRLAHPAMLDVIDDPTIKARARHVVSENQRVRDAVACLRSGDMVGFGELMYISHASMRHDFATSTAQMDSAVSAARATPGVFGARMTGGGFGGCIVIIADATAHIQNFGIESWQVRAVAGAQLLN